MSERMFTDENSELVFEVRERMEYRLLGDWSTVRQNVVADIEREAWEITNNSEDITDYDIENLDDVVYVYFDTEYPFGIKFRIENYGGSWSVTKVE